MIETKSDTQENINEKPLLEWLKKAVTILNQDYWKILFDLRAVDIGKYYWLDLYESVHKRWEPEDWIKQFKNLEEILENWKFNKEYFIDLVFPETERLEKYRWQTVKCKVFLKKFR